MRQAFNQQQIESGWREKAKAALDRRDEDGYRSAIVNLRVMQTLWTARHENWSSWKSRSVCKYVQKTFESMTIAELSIVNDEAVQELISHAAARPIPSTVTSDRSIRYPTVIFSAGG